MAPTRRGRRGRGRPTRPQRRRWSLGAAALGVAVPSAVSPAAASGGVATSPWEPAPIEWTPSPTWPGAEEGWLEVPLDYARPDGGVVRLALARRPAGDPDRRIGSLLVNPGGPGFGGTPLAQQASAVFSPELLARFDIVAWDPRGTGSSEPAIDCIDDYDEAFAAPTFAEDDAARREQLLEAARRFAAACAERNADIIQHVGTNASARDIDAIRRALGEEEVSYFGFSYGSELGATWATLFPHTVRAAVLDSAHDPDAGVLERHRQVTLGFEAALDTFLAECSADESCAFHNDGDAGAAFDELMAALEDEPIETVPDRPPLSRAMALQSTVELLYTDATWGQLGDALAAAQAGRGELLLLAWDAYFQRDANGAWGDGIEAMRTISCMDDDERATANDEHELAALLQKEAPRLGAGTVGHFACIDFPPADDPRVPINGAEAGTILVCAVDGDPATPLEGSRQLAQALEDGRLVIVEGRRHTCYGLDDCADSIIDAYLIELDAPSSDETVCDTD